MPHNPVTESPNLYLWVRPRNNFLLPPQFILFGRAHHAYNLMQIGAKWSGAGYPCKHHKMHYLLHAMCISLAGRRNERASATTTTTIRHYHYNYHHNLHLLQTATTTTAAAAASSQQPAGSHKQPAAATAAAAAATAAGRQQASSSRSSKPAASQQSSSKSAANPMTIAIICVAVAVAV